MAILTEENHIGSHTVNTKRLENVQSFKLQFKSQNLWV